MTYFSYGSNMLTGRLRARTPGAVVLGTARVGGRRLAFRKRSIDGSAKCDLETTNDAIDRAFGVLFGIPEGERAALDRAEGLGAGYEIEEIEVLDDRARPVRAFTYVAMREAIDPTLRPYGWYHRLVMAGARQHGLPRDHIDSIAAIPTCPDPKPSRPARLEALRVLGNVGNL